MHLVITIPEDGKCLLKLGQKVDFTTPFFEKKESADVNLAISEKLGIAPDKILQYTKKFIGEKIEKGDLLAVKSSLFSSHKIYSEYSGIIKEINHYEGKIVISIAKGDKHIVLSYFKGTVEQIKKNEVLIKVASGTTFPLKKVSSDFGGETSYSEELTNVSNKVLIMEKLTPYIAAKAGALGITACVFLIGTDNIDFPSVQVKNIEDFRKIIKLKFPYCTVNQKYSTITFYQL